MTVISVDADGVLTQAVIRCLLAALLSRDEQQLPYINTPLHTVMRVHCVDSMPAHLEMIPLHVDCVDTHRHRPQVFFFCYDLGGGALMWIRLHAMRCNCFRGCTTRVLTF